MQRPTTRTRRSPLGWIWSGLKFLAANVQRGYRSLVTLIRPWLSQLVGPHSFQLAGRRYRYVYHRYNTTWSNERSVEIALAVDAVRRHRGGNILELGNVTAHYLDYPHEVVDKYETADGVINQDIEQFNTDRRYNLIICLSTLEHVGRPGDDGGRPAKALAAAAKLTSLLAVGGELLVTIPVGYNDFLDHAIDRHKLTFDSLHCLRRVSGRNAWVETDWANVRDTQYGQPFPNANALVVGTTVRTA